MKNLSIYLTWSFYCEIFFLHSFDKCSRYIPVQTFLFLEGALVTYNWGINLLAKYIHNMPLLSVTLLKSVESTLPLISDIGYLHLPCIFLHSVWLEAYQFYWPPPNQIRFVVTWILTLFLFVLFSVFLISLWSVSASSLSWLWV